MAKLSSLYASALFGIVSESGGLQETLDQAVLLRSGLEECRAVLVHPRISAAEKHEFFLKAFGGNIGSSLTGLLRLTVDKNREAHLIPALNEFISLAERAQNKTTAHVVSAAEPDAEQIEALKGLIAKKLDKEVVISSKTDPSVIGGPYIQVDGIFIDRTVKKRLRDLTVSMKERCGA